MSEYLGQRQVKERIQISVAAAAKRGEAMDHTLLYGPPGLGKTTLAQVIARELAVGMRHTSGPVLERPGDLAALLTNLKARDVLFIDEVHRLNPVVQELLYPAMEDFRLDIVIGEGPAGAHDAAETQAVHAGGRHHARRAAVVAAARPLRDTGAPRAVLERGTAENRAARRRDHGHFLHA